MKSNLWSKEQCDSRCNFRTAGSPCEAYGKSNRQRHQEPLELLSQEKTVEERNRPEEPINNNLTVTTTYIECGSSSKTTWPTTESHCPFAPSGSASLLNKLAAGISYIQYDLNRIKNILLDPRITSSEQDEKEMLKEGSGDWWL
ncbi:hypothetical protein Bca52824_012965 [Brassica carinata]|uniref:Uncharacterized protein n=1 Tax=Brassica carinata TaxID=52824 RepID=A0A8X8B3G5_BRACI|nr:hypothetical protein Bca52824_012965 [Brassica carinata]